MHKKHMKTCPICGGSGEVEVRIGDRVRALREAKGLDQRQLAEKIFVTQATISQFENGYSEPSIKTFFVLCDVFNVSADEFLFGKTAP